jgi:hypothetical protein
MSEVPLSAFQQAIVDSLGELTLRKTARIGLENASANLPLISHGVDELVGRARDCGSALVIAAGPSLHRRSTVRRIRDAQYRGVIVATDGGLNHCLREGLVPHYVLSLDPHPTRIVRWFGDPDLASRAPDDYFARQELDDEFTHEARTVNARTLELVDRHGKEIIAVLATSVAPVLAERVRAAGMPTYWWNPMYDDFDAPDSVTRKVRAVVPVPAMVTGGNCGTAAWVFAGAILEAPAVAVVGMDLGYREGTPRTHTQYSEELQDIFGDRFGEAFINVPNPYVGETWFTDPTYWWYRQTFLQLAALAPFRTVNCTEGGTLFGDGVEWSTLDDFLERP